MACSRAVLFIAVLNVQLYGGPLISGYGPFFESYAVSAGPSNLHNYLGWLIQTQTPLILLACVPVFVKGTLSDDRDGVSPRAGLVALVLLTFASYVFYAVFDHWYYLRFLLPAYGAIFVLTAAAIRWLALKLPLEAQAPVTAFACGLIMSVGLNVGAETGIFNQAQFEQRYVRAAADVARRTTPKAVVLAVQHSGSVRYYANRITLRYDWVENDALDATIHDLIAAGYQPYLVLEDWEERSSEPGSGRTAGFGKLDWAPLARVPGSPEVRIYAIKRTCENKKKSSGVSGLFRHCNRPDVSVDLASGFGAAERCRRSGIEYLDSVVELTGRAVHVELVECAGVLSRSWRADLFGEPGWPEPHLHAAGVARRWTAGRLQRGLPPDVSAQRHRRGAADLRIDEAARCCVPGRSALRVCPVSYCAPSADTVAGIVSDAVCSAGPASGTFEIPDRAGWCCLPEAGFCRDSATAITCCFSASSSRSGFCGLRLPGRVRGRFLQ